ncbi:MAG: methyltransferase domain-containing protein [Balneola sp.]|nr:MAG: methyltransferase domain-containing protein [Balneola sp.]
MKKHRGEQVVTITHSEVEEYAQRNTTSESEEIKSLMETSDQALEYIDMLSGRLVGQLLKMLIKISGAERVLEIGTFTGYSAIMMSEALPENGEVFTLEMNMKYHDLAKKHFEASKVGHKITLVKGNAQQTLKMQEGSFDLIYLDGDKLRYTFYYEQSLAKLKPGGLIVADNVLWDATVLEPKDHKAQAIADFNAHVTNDERVEQVLLPIRDGVSIIRKK